MREMGATATLHANSADGGEVLRDADSAYDVVIDASGSAAARQSAFHLCTPGGQVALLGMMQQRSEIDFVTSIRKEHRVVMSFAYTPAL